MKIERDIGVHICNDCHAPLDDIDFVRCGISVVRNLQYFFDYHCPRCNHRGRYVFDVCGEISVPGALSVLKEVVSDDETPVPQIDWNAIEGG